MTFIAAIPLSRGRRPPALRPSRVSRTRKAIRRGRSADHRLSPAARPTSRRGDGRKARRSGSASPSSSKAGRRRGTNIATEAVINAPPDGYSLLLVAPANAINATLYEKLNHNFLRDIEPVAGLIRFPNVVVVNPSVPVKTIPELIEHLKANPGKLNMASSGNGSTIHMSGALFKMMTGTDMIHVPYRGGAPALTDMVGGQVQVMFDNVPTAAEFIKRKLRGLAVTGATSRRCCRTSDRRGYLRATRRLVVRPRAPKGTPQEIIRA